MNQIKFFFSSSDASQYLVELASTVPSASLTSWLDQLIDILTKRNRLFLLLISKEKIPTKFILVSSSIVEKSLITNVVQELRAQLSNDSQFVSIFFERKRFFERKISSKFSSEALFSVANAFSMPKYIYSRSMKKFIG